MSNALKELAETLGAGMLKLAGVKPQHSSVEYPTPLEEFGDDCLLYHPELSECDAISLLEILPSRQIACINVMAEIEHRGILRPYISGSSHNLNHGWNSDVAYVEQNLSGLYRCEHCGRKFRMQGNMLECPSCGSYDAKRTG